jgi:hypothetical protein
MIQTRLTAPVVLRSETLTERCDRCGAAAKLHLVLRDDSGVLSLCGHHANKHLEPIVRTAAQVTVDASFDWCGLPALTP